MQAVKRRKNLLKVFAVNAYAMILHSDFTALSRLIWAAVTRTGCDKM